MFGQNKRHRYLRTPPCRLVGILLLAVTSGCAPDTGPAYDPVTMDTQVIDADYPADFHELFIPSHGETLTGFMLGANGAGPHPTVVLLHGYPGNEKNLDLAQSIRRAGFNVLFFHYRGAWGSQGDYRFLNLADDVASALNFLRARATDLRVDVTRLSLVGHSLGGFTALRSGARDSEIVCVVGIAAANLGEFASRADAQLQGFKSYTDQLFMLNNFDGAAALEEISANVEQFDVRKDGPGLAGKSVLLIAGTKDTAVPPDVQERLVLAYGEVSGLKLAAVVIEDDHAFSNSRIKLQHIVVDWLYKDCQ